MDAIHELPVGVVGFAALHPPYRGWEHRVGRSIRSDRAWSRCSKLPLGRHRVGAEITEPTDHDPVPNRAACRRASDRPGGGFRCAPPLAAAVANLKEPDGWTGLRDSLRPDHNIEFGIERFGDSLDG